MNWIESSHSSNVVRYRYDASSQILTLEFKNGSTYNYYDVPQSLIDEMTTAASIGQFHAQNIKGDYRYARV